MWLVLVVLAFAPNVRVRAEDARPASNTTEPTAAELSRARELFVRGVAYADARKFESAAESFREALTIRSAPAIEYNLAAALFELHTFAEAFELVQSVLKNPETTADVRARAEELSASLRLEVARLTVRIDEPADTEVAVDGAVIPAQALGEPHALEKGDHTLSVRRHGDLVLERSLVVSEAADILFMPAIVEQGAVLVGAASTSHAGDERKHAWSRRKERLVWGIATAAVVVGAAVAVSLVVAGQSETAAPASGSFEPGTLSW